MIRRSTHQLLWLIAKIAVVIGLAFAMHSRFDWVGGSVLLVLIFSCVEHASGKRFTKSLLEEAAEDRLAMEERMRQRG